MTKKDLIALADHIKGNPLLFSQRAVESLADFLSRRYPNFNRDRWLDYIDGFCGPNGGAVQKTEQEDL